MPHAIPPLGPDVATVPAYRRITADSDIPWGWTLNVAAGHVPSTVTTAIYDHLSGADVSATVKNGVPTLTGISGTQGVVTQRLHSTTVGKLYRMHSRVTATSGAVFPFVTFFDVVA